MSEPSGRRRRLLTASTVLGAIAVLLVGAVAFRSGDASEREPTDDGTARPAAHHNQPRDPTELAVGSGVDPQLARRAEIVVKAFVEHIRQDDLDDAVQFWSGYPDLVDAPRPTLRRVIEDLGRRNDWLVGSSYYDVLVTRSPDDAFVVATVVSMPEPGTATDALAFVVGGPFDGAEATAHDHDLVIHRLPDATAVTPEPPPGTRLHPGDEILVPLDSRDGLTAHAGTTEMSAEARTAGTRPGTALTMPARLDDDAVITVAQPAPEVPEAHAFTFAGD